MARSAPCRCSARCIISTPPNISCEIGQPYVNTIAVMNKKWLEALPPDLQKIVRDDATATALSIVPFVNEFFAAQRKAWTD